MKINHKNSMLLYGKNSVLQRLRENPQSIKKIFLDESFNDSLILSVIREKKIPFVRMERSKFLKVKHAERLQGIMAEVNQFSYTPFQELLNKKDKQTLIFLDNLSDPHNLGSIIRTVACFGGFALVIPKHCSCEVNDTVLHVATGGENFVPVSMVTNISTSLIQAKDAGFWVAGCTVQDGKDISTVDLPFPLCLVLGSEGKGIRYGVDKHLDLKITLPMSGAKLSFNVAIACAIFCYEISKQRTNEAAR